MFQCHVAFISCYIFIGWSVNVGHSSQHTVWWSCCISDSQKFIVGYLWSKDQRPSLNLSHCTTGPPIRSHDHRNHHNCFTMPLFRLGQQKTMQCVSGFSFLSWLFLCHSVQLCTPNYLQHLSACLSPFSCRVLFVTKLWLWMLFSLFGSYCGFIKACLELSSSFSSCLFDTTLVAWHYWNKYDKDMVNNIFCLLKNPEQTAAAPLFMQPKCSLNNHCRPRYTSNKVCFHSPFGAKKKFVKVERRYTVFEHSNTPALLEAGCRLM